ncbi:MAG: hypothetical protein WD025_08870 [Bacteriovoracaceae bacterium]
MFSLKPHSSNLSPEDKLYSHPSAQVEIKDGVLLAKLSAPMPDEPNIRREFGPGHKNWGLWEYDVFELFLTRANREAPYLELQVSPINQKFALLIKRPREEWIYPESIPFSSVSKVEGGVWKCHLNVPVENIPGNSQEIYGNIHLIIGPESNGKKRSHYSLNPNSEHKPDFHRPDLFVKLGEL